MKRAYAFLLSGVFLYACFKDSDPALPNFNVDVSITIQKEGTSTPIENAVVWITTVNEDPYTEGFEGVGFTDSFGKCLIHFSALGDSVDYYDFINVSKSGYEFLNETVRINDHKIDVTYHLSPVQYDVQAPYFIRLQEDSTNSKRNRKYYSIYFSEEVIYTDIGGITAYFDRKEDICQGGSATITNDSCYYDLSGKFYLVFSHRAIDSVSCLTSTNPDSYTTKSAEWEVTDVRLMNVLCKDLAGNELIPRNIYPKLGFSQK